MDLKLKTPKRVGVKVLGRATGTHRITMPLLEGEEGPSWTLT